MSDKEVKNLGHEEMLEKLLGEDYEAPVKQVGVDRLGVQFTARGLTDREMRAIRRKLETEKADDEFGPALIEAATDFPWSDPRLLEKFKVSSGRQVITRLLLSGEVNRLVVLIADLSGADKDLGEIKN